MTTGERLAVSHFYSVHAEFVAALAAHEFSECDEQRCADAANRVALACEQVRMAFRQGYKDRQRARMAS